MRLPNGENAIIEEKKLRKYLLNVEHPKGGSKARFLFNLGYTVEAWKVLRQDIREQLLHHKVAAVKEREADTLYVIEGALTGPNGKTRMVRVVWEIDTNGEFPKLITLYPKG